MQEENKNSYNSDYNTNYNSNTYNNISFETVERYIIAREYMLARMALYQLPKTSSKWYYYSAIISFNLGDIQTASYHIDVACSMEPNNQTYQNLKTQMENMYYQRKTTKRYKFSFGRLLFSLFKFYIVINIIS